MKTPLILLALLSLPFAAGRSAAPLAAPRPGEARVISAADPRFRYEGRIDLADCAQPVIVWQATRIRLDFSGDTLALLFADTRGQCFFNAEVDGANTVVAVPEGKTARVEIKDLKPGRHELTLVKRCEAAAGTTGFRGIEVAAGAEAWAPAAAEARLKLEFFGDSITAGACNEDGATDQWEDRRTHNGARSYAAFVAAALGAEHRNIAVSGMGIVTGYVPMTAGQIWDRSYPNPSSARADLGAWTPDVVFVNFGENDDSITRGHGKPFPAGFTDGYFALVRAIRAAHPAAEIVLLRGGMYGGARSEPLRAAWTAAVQRLEAGDGHIHPFVFTHWTGLHPRVADDQAMADELTAWLRQQPFLRKP
jgi:lysophospholipase L1-like esterase